MVSLETLGNRLLVIHDTCLFDLSQEQVSIFGVERKHGPRWIGSSLDQTQVASFGGYKLPIVRPHLTPVSIARIDEYITYLNLP